jgi:hypothetical protein
MAVALAAAGEGLAGVGVSVDSAAAVCPAAVGLAAVGSQRGCEWFQRKKLTTL